MANKPEPGELPHYDRLFRAIGEALAEHSLLEDVILGLSLSAAWVADPNVSGDRPARKALHIALLNQAKIGDRVKTAQAILFTALGECTLMTRANELLKDAVRLSEERNRYVHDMWEIDEKSLKTWRAQAKTGLNANATKLAITPVKEMSIEEVEDFSHRLRDKWQELVDIDNALAELAQDPV